MVSSNDSDPQKPRSDQSFSLNQKGLGWLPDVPEKRDYDLFNPEINFNSRLKRNKKTESFEKLGKSLISAVEYIVEKLKEDSIASLKDSNCQEVIGDLKSFSQKLEADIFGEIFLQTATLNKQFRLDDCGPAIPKLKLALSIFFYQNSFIELEKEKLIRHLGVNKFTDYVGSKQKHQEWYIEWIRSEKYEEDTKKLVECFQAVSSLNKTDGIVGIETLSKLQSFYFKLNSDPTLKQQPSLLAAPAIMPSVVFRGLIDTLIHFASEQLVEELNDRNKCFAKIFEQNRLKVVFEKWVKENKANQIEEEDLKIFENLFSGLKSQLGSNREDIAENLRESARALFCSADSSNQGAESLEPLKEVQGYQGLIEQIQEEYTVVESIVAFCLKTFSPLALHPHKEKKFFADVMIWILSQQLPQLPQPQQLQLATKFRALARSGKKEIGRLTFYADTVAEVFQNYDDAALDEFENFVVQAIQQFVKSFDKGLYLVIGEWKAKTCSQKKTFNQKLYLYFILAKVCSLFKPKLTLSVALGDSFRFQKNESFLIEGNLENKASSYRPEEKNSIFPIQPRLIVPFSRKYSKALGDCSTRGQLQYFFLPYAVDLSYWCSAVEDQGSLKSCSAFAGIALLEYFANRTNGNYTDLSALYLYKVARNLMQQSEDLGASLRDTMKAMEKFGVPPAQYWPYQPESVNEEPPQFCYALAQNYQALKYFRLDYSGISEETLLFQIKAVLAAGIPCAFGFTVYPSAEYENNVSRGWIPFPEKNEISIGGHAVVAVGYNDFEVIDRGGDGGNAGAFLIRNSWGKGWGEKGYGWLPYSYVLNGLTADWWSLIDATWFEQDLFGLGAPPSDPGEIFPNTK